MATFNLDSYFNKRLGSPGASKLDGLAQASADKVASLNEFRLDLDAQEAKAKPIRDAQEAALAKSWAGQVSDTPEGFLGTSANVAATVVDATARLASTGITSLHDMNTAALSAGVPDVVRLARQREMSGQQTPEDTALLDMTQGRTPDSPALTQFQQQRNEGAQTNRQRIMEMEKSMLRRDGIAKILDTSSIVNQSRQAGLQEGLVNGYQTNKAKIDQGMFNIEGGSDGALAGTGQVISGIAGLIGSIGATAGDNPMASLELITANIPQLVLASAGAPGMALAVVPYAIDVFGRGVSNYRDQNNGAMPPQEEVARIAKWATGTAVSEYISNKVTLGAGKTAKAIGNTLESGSQATARSGFKASVLGAGGYLANTALGRTAIAGITTGAEEFPVEAFQTLAENKALNLETTGQDAFVGGALGAIAGAGLGGGVNVIGEITKTTPKHIADNKTKLNTFREAAAAANTTTYTDKTSPNYAPADGVSALHLNNQLPTTTDAGRAENLVKANQLVDTLEAERAAAEEAYALVGPERTAQLEEQLSKAKTRLTQVDPADTATVDAVKGVIADVETALAEHTAATPDKKGVHRLKRALDAATKRYEEASQRKSVMEGQQLPTDEQNTADIALVNSTPVAGEAIEVTASRAQAADAIITRSMASPRGLSQESIDSLANNLGNAITPVQRTYLREMSKARIAENALIGLKGVQQEIMEGNARRNQAGITQYQNRMANAIGANSVESADRHMLGLRKFAEGHTAKSAAIAKALASLKQPEQSIVVTSLGNGIWGPAPAGQPAVYGDVTVSNSVGTNTLDQAIRAESIALVRALNEMGAAYEVRFKTPSPETGKVKELPPYRFTAPKVTPSVVVTKPTVKTPAQETTTTKPTGNETADPVLDDTPFVDAIPEGGFDTEVVVEPAPVQTTEVTPEVVAEPVVAVPATESVAPVETAPATLAESIENATAEVTPGVEAAVAEPGGLIALATKDSPEVPFKKRNLLADHMTQVVQGLSSATKRPLVAVKNFMELLVAGTTLASEFLNKPESEITENERAYIALFKKAHKKWKPLITAGLIRGSYNAKRDKNGVRDATFDYKDPFNFLVTELPQVKGETYKFSVEDNVITAIVQAAFQAIQSLEADGRFSSPKAINGILGRSDNAVLPNEAFTLLGGVGSRANMLRNSWGKTAAEALGFKTNTNSPQDMLPKLESALGTLVEKLLIEQGLIKETQVTDAELSVLYKQLAELDDAGSKEKETNEANSADFETRAPVKRNFTTQSFLVLAYNSNGTLASDMAHEMVTTSKGTSGVLDKLFSVEAQQKFPSNEPIEFTQTHTKSGAEVSSEQRKYANNQGARANYAQEDLWNVVSQLAQPVMEAMAGVVTVTDETVHLSKQAGLRSRNDGIRRELANYTEYMNTSIVNSAKKFMNPIFFAYSVWSPQREGIATNVINPQSSKVHRALFYMGQWRSTIRFDDAAMMNGFKLRVAESFGIKTERNLEQKSINEVNALLNTPEMQAGILALRKTLDNLALTPEDQLALQVAVGKGKTNFQALSGLMAMAQHDQIKAAGLESFSTQLQAGVDGVNSGPIIAHATFGAAGSPTALNEFLEKGGIYTLASAFRNFNTWKSTQGSLDVYETLTAKILEKGREALAGSMNWLKEAGMVDAGKYFIGELESSEGITSDGRKFAKSPATEMIFGSGINKSVRHMGDAFVEKIKERIEEISKGESNESIARVIKHMNVLLAKGKKKNGPLITLINPRLTVAEMMKLNLTFEQRMAMGRSFDTIYGNNVKKAVNDQFGAFLIKRQKFTQAAQLSFDLFDSMYRGVRLQIIEELINQEFAEPGTGLPFETKTVNGTLKRVPLVDLSADQEKKVRDRLKGMAPMLETSMSKKSQRLQAGLKIGKTEAQMGQAGSTYEGRTHFFTRLRGEPKGQRSTGTRANQKVAVSPGVSTLPGVTHSSDSAMLQRTREAYELLNVHDEAVGGITTIQAIAKKMNQNTWEVLLESSPMMDIYQTLARTVNGLADYLESNSLPPGVAAELNRVLQGTVEVEKMTRKEVLAQPTEFFKGIPMLRDYMQALKAEAADSDTKKFGAMELWAAVNQYAGEKGQYDVTDADRDRATALKNAVTSVISETGLDNIAFITSQLAQSTEGETAAKEKAFEEAELDSDLAILGETLMNIPASHSMQLLEAVVADESIPQAQRNTMNEVLTHMRQARKPNLGRSLEAVRGTSLEERSVMSKIAAMLTERHARIPTDLWGDQGTPLIVPDSELEAAFQVTPVMDGKSVIKLVYKRLANQKPLDGEKAQNQVMRGLLVALAKTVSPDLKVRYLTPSTEQALILGNPVSNSRGWTATQGAIDEVYVLSSQYKHSGLTPELIVHELLHAALGRALDNPKSPDSAALVTELTALMVASKKHVHDNDITKYDNTAFKDLHEFVSWGMTNDAFQQDVLRNVEFTSTTKGNPLVAGMKGFIAAITGFFFGSINPKHLPKMETGIATLFSNVSGLLSTAAQTAPAAVTALKADIQTRSMVSTPGTTPTLPPLNVNVFTTQQLYSGLASVAAPISATFSNHLQGLLKGIVNELHGPHGSFKETLMANQALTQMDVFQKAMDTGTAPFASKALNTMMKINAQEAFVIEQVEATVRAALEDTSGRSAAVMNTLTHLYQETRALLQPKDFFTGPDWANATPDEINEATDLHKFIFAMVKTNGNKTDHLSRFAAMGLGHEAFNKLLKVATARDSRKITDKMGFGERLRFIFDQVLQFFNGKLTHTVEGQIADSKLTALVNQLVDIEAKRRVKINKAYKKGAMEKIDEAARNAATNVKDRLEGFGRSAMFKNSKNSLVGATGAVISMTAGNRVGVFFDDVGKLYDKQKEGAPGLFKGIINNVQGPAETFQALLRWTKLGEGNRKDVITHTKTFALEGFAEKGVYLTPEMKAGISAVFMRTGAFVLLDKFTMGELQGMLTNQATLNKTINTYAGRLNTVPKYRDYMVTQAEILGFHLATGRTAGAHLMHNAGNIANMFETSNAGTLVGAQLAQVTADVDTLATLFAISHSNSENLSNAASVLGKESSRKDGISGVENILHMHRRIDLEARTKLFEGKEALMQKAYVPDITNPNTAIQMGHPAGNGRELMDLGYSAGDLVTPDVTDADQEEKRIYVLRDGGPMPMVSGILSTSGQGTAGNTVHNGNTSIFTTEGQQNIAAVQAIRLAKRAAIAKLFLPNPNFNPAREAGNHMSAVLNGKGEVTNYRYMMRDSVKDMLLERNNNFEDIFGVMAGGVYGKEADSVHNRKAVQAMYDMHKDDYARNPQAYVVVSAKSKDPAMREIWAMQTDETRKAIRSIWKRDEMVVNKALLDINFGYRKLSLSSMFDKEKGERTYAEHIFGWGVETILKSSAQIRNAHRAAKGEALLDVDAYAKRAGVRVRRGERMWQEIVGEVKDIIVVKTGVVMLGNITSNSHLLAMNGVGPLEMLAHHQVAWKGANDYDRDSRALFRLQAQLNSGYITGNLTEIQDEIMRLENELVRNPVRKLIEEGLMPTIVEDLVADQDQYSYKAGLARKVAEVSDKMNPKLVTTAKVMYMAHDTALYKGLARTTQLSDFMARYTLYQHLTQRGGNPMGHAEAIQKASDAFINYDLPMHRTIQYTDDMGFTMFTKYFLGIQRVIMQLVRDHPAQVITAMMLNNYVTEVTSVLDSAAINRLGSLPGSSGALQFPGLIPEIMPMQAATQILKAPF